MIGKVGLKTAENPGFVGDFWAFVTKKSSTFDHIDYNVLSHQFFHIVFSKKYFFHNKLKLPKLRLEISGKFGT